MKFIKLLATLLALVICALLPVQAETVLPASGTYFVVSASNGEALQPNGPTLGQNVFTQTYDKSGAQKWTFTRLVDPKTKKPTNRYNIRLAGETQGLWFMPHDVKDMNAIISMDKTVFVLVPSEGGFVIKSVRKNGDAMYSSPSPPSYTEVHFGPSDGSARFLWNLEPAS